MEDVDGTGEEYLWAAVIAQGLYDISSSVSTNPKRKSRAREARAWFFSAREEPNLREVCERAGVDVGRVRRIAERLASGELSPTGEAEDAEGEDAG